MKIGKLRIEQGIHKGKPKDSSSCAISWELLHKDDQIKEVSTSFFGQPEHIEILGEKSIISQITMKSGKKRHLIFGSAAYDWVKRFDAGYAKPISELYAGILEPITLEYKEDEELYQKLLDHIRKINQDRAAKHNSDLHEVYLSAQGMYPDYVTLMNKARPKPQGPMPQLKLSDIDIKKTMESLKAFSSCLGIKMAICDSLAIPDVPVKPPTLFGFKIKSVPSLKGAFLSYDTEATPIQSS